MKILEIESCGNCPKLLWTNNGKFCDKRSNSPRIYHVNDIPSWCPLPDKTEQNRCTCERCTGIPLESLYEEEEGGL